MSRLVMSFVLQVSKQADKNKDEKKVRRKNLEAIHTQVYIRKLTLRQTTLWFYLWDVQCSYKNA